MIIKSHKANITELSKKPARAHLLDLSVNKPKMLTTNDSGGTNNTKTLPKSPDRPPHPKPGHNNAGITNNQGDKASQKLALPNLLTYFMW